MKKSHLLIALIVVFLPITIVAAEQNSRKIRAAIIADIERTPDIGAYELTVDARYGAVELSGRVRSADISQEIEHIAAATHGVRKVTNLLTVDASLPGNSRMVATVPEYTQPSDAQISEQIRAALRKEIGLRADALALETKDGVVTLRGEQSSFRDVDKILSIALMIDGVQDIHSEIKVGGRSYMQAAPH